MHTLRISVVCALVGLLVLGLATAQKVEQKKEIKIVLPKVADGARADVGKLAPDFVLKDLDGKEHTLERHLGKIVVLEWLDPTCPYCVHARSETGALREQPIRLKGQGVVWLTLNSTDPALDGGKSEANKAFVKTTGLGTPLLLDSDGAVGRAYGAHTTPHCFVINEKGLLVYKGALDNAPLGKVQGDQKKANYVDAAIADIKAGRAVAISDTKPYGSTIKYRKTSTKR